MNNLNLQRAEYICAVITTQTIIANQPKKIDVVRFNSRKFIGRVFVAVKTLVRRYG